MALQVKPLEAAAAASSAGRGAVVRLEKHLRAQGSDFSLNADFAAPPGITILFGPSGAGKTTVLECVAGLLTPERGRITAGERVLFDSQQGINLPPARRRIGYVFQTLALFPHLSVEANIQYGLSRLSSAEREQRTAAITESFRIAPLRRRKPRDISGGERQRVALARTLVTEPSLLLLDEPLSALDLPTKALILDDLRAWNRARRIPILYVTHSRDEVFALGEGVIVLEQGRVLARGTPLEVLETPRQESIAQLAGFENIFDAELIAVQPQHGAMTCRVRGAEVRMEVPLARFEPGALVRVAIRAGDILVAIRRPEGLSARNLLPGRILALHERDGVVALEADCGGASFHVHLTPSARESLDLQVGREVWLVIKTHSCHLLHPTA
jgi:molybdate transport system ATP-binding protein